MKNLPPILAAMSLTMSLTLMLASIITFLQVASVREAALKQPHPPISTNGSLTNITPEMYQSK
jgi:hypothetical protein